MLRPAISGPCFYFSVIQTLALGQQWRWWNSWIFIISISRLPFQGCVYREEAAVGCQQLVLLILRSELAAEQRVWSWQYLWVKAVASYYLTHFLPFLMLLFLILEGLWLLNFKCAVTDSAASLELPHHPLIFKNNAFTYFLSYVVDYLPVPDLGAFCALFCSRICIFHILLFAPKHLSIRFFFSFHFLFLQSFRFEMEWNFLGKTWRWIEWKVCVLWLTYSVLYQDIFSIIVSLTHFMNCPILII